MPTYRSVPVLTCLLAMLSLACCTATPRLTDHSGGLHTPLTGEAGELVVMVFSSTDCPIANAMAPDIERASVETSEVGGRFYLVHARQDLSDEQTRAHAGQYKLSMPVIVDRSHTLVKALNATVTPAAFVLRMGENGGYTVIYQGSVNNLYGSVGNRRQNVTEHHLRNAIRSAAGGDAIEVPRRAAFGCFIERN